jgi:uncharacterized membrane protein YhdT
MAKIAAATGKVHLVAVGRAGGVAMNASERLGVVGWAALALLALAVVTALLFGFASVFYFAILLVPVMFVVMIQLCTDNAKA